LALQAAPHARDFLTDTAARAVLPGTIVEPPTLFPWSHRRSRMSYFLGRRRPHGIDIFFIAYLIVLFQVVVDLFRDGEMAVVRKCSGTWTSHSSRCSPH
jgi:hypothetical protein